MVNETITESDSRRNDSTQYNKLEFIYDNLFYPIDEKRIGKYWNEPVNNTEELVKYANDGKMRLN